MQPGFRGVLLSASFAKAILPSMPGVHPLPPARERDLANLADVTESCLGPTSSSRQVADAFALPLLRILGVTVARRSDASDEVDLMLTGPGEGAIAGAVLPWDTDTSRAWRRVVHHGISLDARWCLALNGRTITIFDTHHTWSQRALDIDVAALATNEHARRLLWTLTNGEALTTTPPLIERAARLSDEYGLGVSRALGTGVVHALTGLFEALRPRATSGLGGTALLEQCLTIVYRILFLLFAEARGLVPIWHPVYRDRYTIGAIVTTLLAGTPYKGTWNALQAISRMAHGGCVADAWSMTAFNGQLFSPRRTADVERRRVADAVMAEVLLRLCTARTSQGIVRTRYDELDVEQLGAIYERVLEYQPAGQRTLQRTRDTRKATGTFYTPREIAASLVERTLAPLVDGRSAEQMLQLRIVDPAMGSGAFLVAACRFLARRIEDARIAEGVWRAADVTEIERIALRREIVQRCLYGVDLNPVAVQLARLSLWLLALAGDKPLSFLDHHLVAGDTLVGASPSDLSRPVVGGTRIRSRPGALPLFDEERLEDALRRAGDVRTRLGMEPDDTAATVRAKEQRLDALFRADSPLAAWKRALDLWCATWFWEQGVSPRRAVVADVTSWLLTGRAALDTRAVAQILDTSDRLADTRRFLHWSLVFPEIFYAERPGFDAVIGNPPWDMLRGDSGGDEQRRERRRDTQALGGFVRDAGIYHVRHGAHVNQYALFCERALTLVREGGRLGLVLPGSVFSDAGSAGLRARLLGAVRLDRLVGLDNRAGIFPIHRSIKFVLLTATAGAPTESFRCSFGVSSLHRVAEAWRGQVRVSRALLERMSGGDDLALPEITSSEDLRILEQLSATVPTLGEARGWNVRFGRELNLTDDRPLMAPAGDVPEGRPVVEGKVLTPFRVDLERCALAVRPDAVLPGTIPRRARLAYREVASAGNRMTLIAAVLPARAVAAHTVFCLKSPLAPDAQHVLCTLLNSFVANYVMRMRVSTHVTAALMARLRVPVVSSDMPAFAQLRDAFIQLSRPEVLVETHPAFADAQACVAQLYGLDVEAFRHVLASFPLVPADVRDACLARFTAARTA